jgi:hypothetical protein
MRILCEIEWEKDDQPLDGNTIMEKGKYWLHHWGLKHEIIQAEEGKLVAVSWTVGICENYETGQIELFAPEQIRILGTEIKT